MWPDRVSNPGPLARESHALRSPVEIWDEQQKVTDKCLNSNVIHEYALLLHLPFCYMGRMHWNTVPKINFLSN